MGKATAKVIKRVDDTEATLAKLDGKDLKELAREKRLDSVKQVQVEAVQDLNQFNSSGVYHLNYPVSEFEAFIDIMDRYVAFMFPHYLIENKETGERKRVEVYIDTPKTERADKICLEKARIMKAAGKLYYVYREGRDVPLTNPADLEDEANDEDQTGGGE